MTTISRRRASVRRQQRVNRRPAPPTTPAQQSWSQGYRDAVNGEPYNYLSPDDDAYLAGWRTGLDVLAGVEPF